MALEGLRCFSYRFVQEFWGQRLSVNDTTPGNVLSHALITASFND